MFLHYQALEPPKVEAMDSAISLLYEVLSNLLDHDTDSNLNVSVTEVFDFSIHLILFNWQKL